MKNAKTHIYIFILLYELLAKMKKAIVEKANEGKSVAKEPKRVCF